MNKEDIKKALECCVTYKDVDCNNCPCCPYDGQILCQDVLCKDAHNLITKQEQEIAELKAAKNDWKQRYESLDQRYMALVASSVECVDKKVKKAKTDVLNELKSKCHNYYPSIDYYCCSVKAVTLSDIEEMIEEVRNE